MSDGVMKKSLEKTIEEHSKNKEMRMFYGEIKMRNCHSCIWCVKGESYHYCHSQEQENTKGTRVNRKNPACGRWERKTGDTLEEDSIK